MPWYLDLDSSTKNLAGPPLDLDAFNGSEGMSRLFRFELLLSSSDEKFDSKSLVGKMTTFSVRVQPDSGGKPSSRLFNGYICRSSAAASRVEVASGDRKRQYKVEVVPWLWLLTLNNDCRVFQDKSVKEIVAEVLGDEKYSNIAAVDDSRLGDEYPKLDYCVQYEESDFAFVSRLLEQEGIYYYFVHDQAVNPEARGSHTLVLCDDASGYYPCLPSGSQASMDYADPAEDVVLTAWEHQHELVTGQYALSDYDYQHITTGQTQKETPATDLLRASPTTIEYSGTAGGGSLVGGPALEVFEYSEIQKPSEIDAVKMTDDGLRKRYTDRRMEEHEAAHSVVHSASTCTSLSPGGRFTLAKHHWPHENGAYAIVSIEHAVSVAHLFAEGSGESYSNKFTCIPAPVNFRPKRSTPRPSIDGTLPALVVGPDGNEVYTDKYGRVKVQFFWDRYGTRMRQAAHSTSSWVRCAQPFAGKGWGGMFIPRIGQEVVVAFEEGNPDRPVITGVVYNEEQPLPYDPSQGSNAFITAIKTNSEGGDGFNEIRMYDRKDQEQFFVHAQRDMDTRIGNDKREYVGQDQHTVVHRDDVQ